MNLKVLIPTIISLGSALILIVLGLVFSDSHIQDIGIGVFTTSILHLGVGYQMPNLYATRKGPTRG